MKLKSIFLTVGILFFVPVALFAQSEVKEEGGSVVESRSDTIWIKKGEHDLHVKVYKEIPDGDTICTQELFSGYFCDEQKKNENLSKFPFMPNKGKKDFEADYPFFYLSFGQAGSGAMSYSSRYPQRTGKSVEWGFNVYNSELVLDKKNHWGFIWALGFAYTRYVFDENAALEKVDGNVLWTPAPDGVDYTKSWLRYWSFRIPLCIEWQKNIKNTPLFFAAGPEVEIRYAMKSKVKIDGHDHTLTSNPNPNVLGLNLLFQAGYGNLGFIARFGMTPIMNSSRAPHLYHGSLGFGIYF